MLLSFVAKSVKIFLFFNVFSVFYILARAISASKYRNIFKEIIEFQAHDFYSVYFKN